MITHHFIVKGFVQGVGYRFTIYLNATKLGVKGTIKNLSNGDVEIFAQGNDLLIQDFKKYLKLGSSFSKVSNIEENILEMENFKNFEILY